MIKNCTSEIETQDHALKFYYEILLAKKQTAASVESYEQN